jgi:hypothetical protein
MSGISSMFFFLFGMFAVGLFHADLYFPIWLSVVVFVFVSLYLLQLYRNKRLGILMLLIWLVYAMPFIHIPPYIWFDFSQNPHVLWGIIVNPYMLNQRIITLTAMIGAVGGLGIALGLSLNKKRVQRDSGTNVDGSKRLFRTMAMPIWLVWVAIGVALSALSAPQKTLFSAKYTASISLLDSIGFNFASAMLMSYVILSFAFCDALLERRATIKYLKNKVILASIILVVVYYQLLRGDRESMPWVFGLALAYFYWAAKVTQRRSFTIPWSKIACVAFGLAAVSMVLGAARASLLNASLADVSALIGVLYESDSIGLANALHGTWSAVLLTPLSVAGDHINGLLAAKWGQDYLNLFLSIVPGFLANAIDYIRPIDALNGPAWEMRYGMGGTHATVVPFMNFRMLGVFLVPAIWSYIMGKYEKSALRKISTIRLSLLVSIATVSPTWLWYGDKNGFNAIVLWLIFSFFYLVSLILFRPKGMRTGLKLNTNTHDVKP